MNKCPSFFWQSLSHFWKASSLFLLSSLLLILSGCDVKQVIVSDVEEREANQIIVFLASRGITAEKVSSRSSSGVGGGGDSAPSFSIAVDQKVATEAMAFLSQNGLPRKKTTNLLTLFAKAGLMSSDKEELIRYHAGLAEEIASTIRKIDGVLEADVQLSFPAEEGAIPGIEQDKRVSASVYVKHQGVLDDPNSHLVTKIKLLVAGSINNLDVNDVTVISDRSRLTEAPMQHMMQPLTAQSQEYVNIWSVTVNKDSATRFRTIFFLIAFASFVLAITVIWFIWKFYPILRKQGGFKSFFQLKPIPAQEETSLHQKEEGEENRENPPPSEGDLE